jgi:hypothetical protein
VCPILTKGAHFNILKVLMATRINFVDIYTFYNDMDLNVVELLFEDLNISCSVKTLNPLKNDDNLESYPEKRIAVEEGDVGSARSVIVEAIESGIISKDGRFVE